ncbi:MAG: hypothetical protein GY895_04420 [Phycisphaera sp.]|nr:hypothetical protein [Phycisphaera sp.]
MILRFTPLLGLLGSIGLGLWALFAPADAAWASPVLTGSVTGGLVCLALIGSMSSSSRRRPAGDQPTLEERLARIEEHAMLSDGAKRLLYRDRELDLLRMILEQDIASGQHDAALHLVDELGANFGRLEEAEHHRGRIDSIRRSEVEGRIAEGMQSIRRLLANGEWNAATGAADRLHRLLPDAPGLDGLVNQIASARHRHAIEVETRMRDAHAEGRIDEAMHLLRDLDRHLVGEESSRAVDVAQPIIVAHRDLVGRRFRDAVGEKRWKDAVELGESIAREYPNTRMAEEVGEMLPVLRQRQNATEAGSGVGSSPTATP